MNHTSFVPSEACTLPLHTPPEPTTYDAANTGTPRKGQPDTAGATPEVIYLTQSQLATTWGRLLPSPTATAEPDSFDARVEKAWRFMRNMFFTPEEHAAMAEALQGLIATNKPEEATS